RSANGSQPATPKYQDPKTGKTWSGRGREPSWIKGKKRDRFLIAE
ncbi:H-NS histone family protein, partial [Bacillus velezensis]|nr:H-NS histone family protein [Bacillus velezensis]